MDSPGPGAYSTQIDFAKPSSPSFTLSGKKPLAQLSSESPGPGAYVVTNKFEGPAYTLSGMH